MSRPALAREPEPTDEVASNPIIAWFDALPEEEKAAYDRMAEAGRLYKGDVDAELAAICDGTPPLSAGPGSPGPGRAGPGTSPGSANRAGPGRGPVGRAAAAQKRKASR